MDDIVAEQNREWFAAHMPLGNENRVPKAFRFLLADVVDVGHVADRAHGFRLVGVSFGFEHALELDGSVEMVFE